MNMHLQLTLSVLCLCTVRVGVLTFTKRLSAGFAPEALQTLTLIGTLQISAMSSNSTDIRLRALIYIWKHACKQVLAIICIYWYGLMYSNRPLNIQCWSLTNTFAFPIMHHKIIAMLTVASVGPHCVNAGASTTWLHVTFIFIYRESETIVYIFVSFLNSIFCFVQYCLNNILYIIHYHSKYFNFK